LSVTRCNAALSAQPRHGLVQSGSIGVGKRHTRAVRRHDLREGEPKAARRAGDKGHMAAHIEEVVAIHVLLPFALRHRRHV
jgi:hypothetical protein